MSRVIIAGAAMAAMAAMGVGLVASEAREHRQQPARAGHERRRHKAVLITDPAEAKPQRYHKGEAPADLAAIDKAAAKRARKAAKRLQIAKGE